MADGSSDLLIKPSKHPIRDRILLYGGFLVLAGLLFRASIPTFVPHPSREKVSRVKNDQRNIATALETYFIEHEQYPPPGPPLISLARYPQSTGFPVSLSAPPSIVTTPTAYTRNIPVDPFIPRIAGSLPGAYLRTEEGQNFLLISPGPDHDFDFDPEIYMGADDHVIFDVVSILYDPSNGVISGGDMIRTRRGIPTAEHFTQQKILESDLY